MSYERLGLLSDVEPVLHRHGYSTGDCAVLFAIANAENTNLTKKIDAGDLDPYSKVGLDAWCRAGAASIAFAKGLTERFVFAALQKLELDGLIEVRRRTRTRGGEEKRSFSWPDWRRLNLSAFMALERGLTQTAIEVDIFRNGGKRIVTRLDYVPYLNPEDDISTADGNITRYVVDNSLGWGGDNRRIGPLDNRYQRDAILVSLRSEQGMQTWNLYPLLGEDAGGKIAHFIAAQRGESTSDGPRALLGEMAPWLIDHIEDGLFEILSEQEEGYHFASSFQRDQALEYLKLRLSPLNFTCVPVEAIDKEGIARPSIATASVKDELTSPTV